MLWNDFSKRRMLAKSRCVTVNTTGLGRGKNDVPNNDRIDCDEEHEENGMQRQSLTLGHKPKRLKRGKYQRSQQ